MKNIKSLAVYSLFAVALVLPFTLASERAENSERKSELMERKAERDENREQKKLEFKEMTCERITERLDIRESRHDTIVSTHKRHFENLVSRLENLLAKLEEEGIDTGDLPAHLTELKSLFATYLEKSDIYKAELVDAKSLACGEDKTAFKTQLEEMKAAHETMVNAGKAVRDYFHNTVRADLEKLRVNINGNTTEKTRE